MYDVKKFVYEHFYDSDRKWLVPWKDYSFPLRESANEILKRLETKNEFEMSDLLTVKLGKSNRRVLVHFLITEDGVRILSVNPKQKQTRYFIEYASAVAETYYVLKSSLEKYGIREGGS